LYKTVLCGYISKRIPESESAIQLKKRDRLPEPLTIYFRNAVKISAVEKIMMQRASTLFFTRKVHLTMKRDRFLIKTVRV